MIPLPDTVARPQCGLSEFSTQNNVSSDTGRISVTRHRAKLPCRPLLGSSLNGPPTRCIGVNGRNK
jgi:hypothetical protein